MANFERGPAAGNRSVVPPLLDGEFCEDHVMDLGGRTMNDGDASYEEFVSSIIQAPTLLMTTLLERARNSKLPQVVPLGFAKQLRPDAMHQLSLIRRVFQDAPDGTAHEGKVYEWARALCRLCLRDDQDGTRPYLIWLDFDMTLISRLVEASNRQRVGASERFVVPEGRSGFPIVPTAPRWAGSHSFAQVYARTAEVARSQEVESFQYDLPVKQVMGVSEAHQLAEAHVLRMDPAQVEVLPEWESPQEVFDYADEAMLPFDPIYLDFAEPGGYGPVVAHWANDVLTMCGALVWRQEGVLMVAPYGWPTRSRPVLIREAGERSPFESCGWFAFGAPSVDVRDGALVGAGAVRLKMIGFALGADAATVYADACAGVSFDAPTHLPGYAILPYSFEAVRDEVLRHPDDLNAATQMATWGEMIWLMAAKALAALSITEAVEVEIVDAPMEKRDMKRALKRGWPIAQQVVIRSHSKRYRQANEPSGEEAHYSHRFWRRATVAHYPLGTMMADARPDLVTPCNRPLESNCGFCRKVRRPACIVGPKDKPLVLKTLVRRAS